MGCSPSPWHVWRPENRSCNEETEQITIERDDEGSPLVIELTKGVCIVCTLPASRSMAPTEEPAA